MERFKIGQKVFNLVDKKIYSIEYDFYNFIDEYKIKPIPRTL